MLWRGGGITLRCAPCQEGPFQLDGLFNARLNTSSGRDLATLPGDDVAAPYSNAQSVTANSAICGKVMSMATIISSRMTNGIQP